MSALLFVLAGAAGAALGRALLGRWFNHLTLYALVWGGALALYAAGLIHYYPITWQAWASIAIAAAELALGAVTVILLARRPREADAALPRPPVVPERTLAIAILALTACAALAMGLQWVFLARRFGGIGGALFQSVNERYQMRVAGETGGIPYAGALALTAAAFAGIHTARIRRLDLVGLLPLVVVALQGVTAAGRMGMGVGGALFVATLILARRRTGAATAAPPALRSGPVSRLGPAIGLVVVLAVLIGGFSFVSGARGLVTDLPGVDPAMARYARYVPFVPSLYGSLSVGPPTFSEYLKAGAPRVAPGAYSFAPFLRGLRRLGVGPGVPYYEEQYFTPVPSNTGTWLKNTYAEFGAPGIVALPFLVGALAAWLMVRTRQGRLSTLVVLAHVLAVVIFSFSFNIMVLGDWWVSALVGWLLAAALDRRARAAPGTPAVVA